MFTLPAHACVQLHCSLSPLFVAPFHGARPPCCFAALPKKSCELRQWLSYIRIFVYNFPSAIWMQWTLIWTGIRNSGEIRSLQHTFSTCWFGSTAANTPNYYSIRRRKKKTKCAISIFGALAMWRCIVYVHCVHIRLPFAVATRLLICDSKYRVEFITWNLEQIAACGWVIFCSFAVETII